MTQSNSAPFTPWMGNGDARQFWKTFLKDATSPTKELPSRDNCLVVFDGYGIQNRGKTGLVSRLEGREPASDFLVRTENQVVGRPTDGAFDHDARTVKEQRLYGFVFGNFLEFQADYDPVSTTISLIW